MKSMKLLRDNFPDGNYSGEPYQHKVVDKDTHNLLLIGKLHEEIEEVRDKMDDPEEYADVLKVLQNLAEANGVKWSAVMVRMYQKALDRCGYLDRKVLMRR